jgi:iron-sulfur cluster assembly accessory protein
MSIAIILESMRIRSNMNIEITEKAKKKLEEYGVGKCCYLRVAVESGGCAGMKFTAEVVSEIAENEEIIGDFSLNVISDARSSLFLDGLKIDFSDDLIQGGFMLTNQNAEGACGCGASFQA